MRTSLILFIIFYKQVLGAKERYKIGKEKAKLFRDELVIRKIPLWPGIEPLTTRLRGTVTLSKRWARVHLELTQGISITVTV